MLTVSLPTLQPTDVQFAALQTRKHMSHFHNWFVYTNILFKISFSFLIPEDKDFPLLIEPETEFEFPEHLKVYTYEMGSDWTMFPEPKRGKTSKYYRENI